MSSDVRARGSALGGRAARLVEAIQQLSLARDIERIAEIVRSAARELSSADGATFVLRDGQMCFYADEDAIGPLWKGKRFPLTACVSGWAMEHRETVVVPDIYVDPRVPIEAYRPTFVRSLAMVPIRTASPIGAIGHYWARMHAPSAEDLEYLQALADSTSIAIENVQLYADLERRVYERTKELEAANTELATFSYSVSHDLRAPLRAIDSFTRGVLDDQAATLRDSAKSDLGRVLGAATRMGTLIDDLLRLSQVGHGEVTRQRVDLSKLARTVADELAAQQATSRLVRVEIADGLAAAADPRLARVVLENLLSNATKFSQKVEVPRVEIGTSGSELFVRDNGAGFDMQHAGKLFKPFSRLHSEREFAGTGIGLATVERVIRRHQGRIRAESVAGEGATFYFSFEPEPP